MNKELIKEVKKKAAAILPRKQRIILSNFLNNFRLRFKYGLHKKAVKKIKAVFPILHFLLHDKHLAKEKKILGIWNFNISGPSLGVFLEFQMHLLCLSENHGIDKIDIAFIYDKTEKITNKDVEAILSEDNFYTHFEELMPMLNINPKLGSVLLFDSRNNFENFFLDNQEKYLSHPSFNQYLNHVCTYHCGTFSFIRNFYFRNKSIPKFEFKRMTKAWVKEFIKNNIKDFFMVTVNLRNNPLEAGGRNSDLNAWRDLFTYCLNKYKVKFVVLGRAGEVKNDFPSNVIFAKNYGANIEKELALINYSLFHIGMSSGPAGIVLLSPHIPATLFRFRLSDKENNHTWLKYGRENFPWYSSLQKNLPETETKAGLIKEFEFLFNNTDKEKWKETVLFSQINENILKWPFK